MRLSTREFKGVNNSFRRFYQKNVEFHIFKAMLGKHYVDLEGKRIMDAGCGSGYSSRLIMRRYHPSKLTAFDLMQEQIDLARSRYPDITFRTGNLLDISEANGSHDAAFVFAVIHHIPDWPTALRELARCLVDGGYLLIEEPHYRFDFPELEAGIEQAGFEILERRAFAFGYFHAYLARKRHDGKIVSLVNDGIIDETIYRSNQQDAARRRRVWHDEQQTPLQLSGNPRVCFTRRQMMNEPATTNETKISGGRDMQAAPSRSLPFKNSQMNFFFVFVAGADIYGGASLGECYYAADRIHSGDINSWIAAFGQIGAQAEAQAREQLAKEHRISARESLLRAANYYFGADHYTDNTHPDYQTYWSRSVACFKQACALFDPPIEVLAIPYEGKTLPGYFVPALGPAKGTLLAMSGFDGTAESLYFTIGCGLSHRYYNVLMFEGPGQRGVCHVYSDLPFRADYEAPIKAVVDYALARPDVDPARLGLTGYSFGGHLVLRAAAHEPRLTALIADSPVADFGQTIISDFPTFLRTWPPRFADAFMKFGIRWQPQTLQASLKRLYESMDVNSISNFFARMAEFKFSEIERITCPTLCLVSASEGAGTVEKARQVHAALPNPQKSLVMFNAQSGADIHCQCNNVMQANHAIADWLDEIWS